ncbi:zinc-dependent peptidase [Psychroserpens sp. SPM9]|uniref:M90 family metallopeptidase n=1 Tax=Psychroserpens sp. SPM9 TaxID=2975598 RepID=UPI0021A4384A|nr:M90 family metallopeptidase [Psychroserpens sp. SPM9]MDG5490225.1 zinc-dependent peptidase [Psychroserpens sp. SPM9]
MLYILVFVLLLVFVVYVFYKKYSRNIEQFPSHWHAILLKEVRYYKNLEPSEQKRFQTRMMQFLSEVYIDSVGFEIEELDKILIASSAVIPVFSFAEWHYPTLSGIIIYPDNFNEDFQFSDQSKSKRIAGVVGTGRLEKKMILSRKALYHGFKNTNDKRNTAIHEFVHLIDKMDDNVDGIPEVLMQNAYTIPWLKLVHDEMEAINKDKSDIRAYGGTKQAEFFAVASEYFFENPKLMKRKHPELYKMLADCFRIKV